MAGGVQRLGCGDPLHILSLPIIDAWMLDSGGQATVLGPADLRSDAGRDDVWPRAVLVQVESRLLVP
jgi:hypothetical protein